MSETPDPHVANALVRLYRRYGQLKLILARLDVSVR